MAKTKQSAKEFVQSTFPPMVAVMASPSANDICLKNKLVFSEMLQPFSRVQMEIHVREPSGTVAVMKELRISISDWTSRPPQSMLARKYLNESVSQFTTSPTKSVKIGKKLIDVPISTPWFEQWRETFLKVQFPFEHEFTSHYIACFIGVSAAEENLTGTLTFMNQELSQSINANANLQKLPKWFGVNICKYFVMIHDVSVIDADVAKASFDTLKTFHGESNCFLLPINSQPLDPTKPPCVDLWAPYVSRRSKNTEETDTPEQRTFKVEPSLEASTLIHPLSPEADNILFSPSLNTSISEKDVPSDLSGVRFGELLSTEDVIRIKQLIKDFINKALIPFAESQIHNLTEIIANKKGVSRTLFSATKRWFGTNKPGMQSPGVVSSPTSVVYSHDSQELQLRCLGDLCFMFGLYSLAFQAFLSAKRDFGADSAWLHYAGSLEMASLSAYLANIETRKAMEYLEEAIGCYLNHCKMSQFATRATLLSFEFLKDIGSYSEAARQLVRMTSEDSDLRSGILLEQAAYCFLYAAGRNNNMGRKYAFHLVLAGHRYSKAKQRHHSLRCYQQAYQVFENSGWNAALDHIHLTIGKHTAALQQLEASVEAMAKLMGPSKQLPAQQTSHLRDFIGALQQLNKNDPSIKSELALPQVNHHSIKILVGTPIDDEKLVGIPAVGVNFHESKTSIAKWHKLEEQILGIVLSNVAFVFKPLVSLYNVDSSSTSLPLAVVGEKVSVNIELWNPMNIPIHLKDLSLEVTCPESTIDPLPLIDLTLAPDSKTEVTLCFVPRLPGEVHIEGIQYHLCSSNREDLICIPGTQKFNTTPLVITVIAFSPCLQIYFRNFQSLVLAQELQELRCVFKNLGSQPIRRLLLASPSPSLFSLSPSIPLSPNITEVPLPSSLAPGACYTLPLWLQAPPCPGLAQIDLLFYYDSESPLPSTAKNKLRYRLLQHTFHLNVLPSIQCSVVAFQSHASSDTAQTVNLKVQMKNTSHFQDSEPVSSVISLDHISLSSSNWKLKHPINFPFDTILLDKQEVSNFLIQVESSDISDLASRISDIDITGGPSLGHPPFHSFLHKCETNDLDLDNGTFIGNLVLRWKGTVTDNKTGQAREALGQHILPLDHLEEVASPPPHTLPVSPMMFFHTWHNDSSQPSGNRRSDEQSKLIDCFLKYTTHLKQDCSVEKRGNYSGI